MKEHHHRSIVKTVTYRILGTLVTSLLVFLFSHKLAFAFAAGGVDTLIKLFLYYFHERTWDQIPWGKKLEMGQTFVG